MITLLYSHLKPLTLSKIKKHHDFTIKKIDAFKIDPTFVFY